VRAAFRESFPTAIKLLLPPSPPPHPPPLAVPGRGAFAYSGCSKPSHFLSSSLDAVIVGVREAQLFGKLLGAPIGN